MTRPPGPPTSGRGHGAASHLPRHFLVLPPPAPATPRTPRLRPALEGAPHLTRLDSDNCFAYDPRIDTVNDRFRCFPSAPPRLRRPPGHRGCSLRWVRSTGQLHQRPCRPLLATVQEDIRNRTGTSAIRYPLCKRLQRACATRAPNRWRCSPHTDLAGHFRRRRTPATAARHIRLQLAQDRTDTAVSSLRNSARPVPRVLSRASSTLRGARAWELLSPRVVTSVTSIIFPLASTCRPPVICRSWCYH